MISAAWSASLASPTYTATAVSLSLPSTVKGGDVMVLRLAWNNGGSGVTCTDPAGWTLLDTASQGACSLSTYYRVAAGTVGGASTDASSAVTATLSSAKAFAITCDGYAGVHQTSPINAHVMAAETVSGTSHTASTVTTTAANCWVVSVIAERVSTVSFTQPTGFTARAYASNAGRVASPITVDAADIAATTAGSQSGGTWTGGASATTQVIIATVALAPAATSSGTPTLAKQTVGSNATGTANQAISFTNTIGNLLVLLYARSGGLATGQVTSITDASGNTWTVGTRGAVSGGTNTRLEAWYCANAASTTRITVNSGTSQVNSWSVLEFSGVATTTPLDVASGDNSATASSTTVATPSITTANASDLLIAAAHFPQTTTTAPSGWTALTDYDYSTTGSGRGAYQVVSATGTYSASWTAGSAVAAGVLTLAFKAGAASAQTKTLSGRVAPAAGLTRATKKNVTASVAPTGSKRAIFSRALSGAVAPTGVKRNTFFRSTFGTLFPQASLTRGYPKVLSSTLFTAGGIARAVGKRPTGTVTPAGSAVKGLTARRGGAVGSAGSPQRTVLAFRSALIQPLGTASRISTRFRTFSGTIAATASVQKLWLKKPTGSIAPSNTPRLRSFKKRPSGATRPTGSLLSAAVKRLFGRAGKTELTIAPSVDMDVSFYLRHRAQMIMTVVADAETVGE